MCRAQAQAVFKARRFVFSWMGVGATYEPVQDLRLVCSRFATTLRILICKCEQLERRAERGLVRGTTVGAEQAPAKMACFARLAVQPSRDERRHASSKGNGLCATCSHMDASNAHPRQVPSVPLPRSNSRMALSLHNSQA